MYKTEIVRIIKEQKDKFRLKDKIKSVHVSKLGAGENHLSVLVVVNNKYKLVFRIGLRKEFEKNMEREFEILKKLPKGLGPRPLYLDISKKIIPHTFSVLSYVEGEKVMRWSKKHLLSHAKQLALLHKKRFSYYCNIKEQKMKTLNLPTELERILKKDFFNQRKDKDVKVLLPKIKEYIKENNHLFTSLKRFSLIHGDAYVDNILFYKGEARYIDWEWSQIGDNALDLATFYSHDCSIRPWIIQLSEKEVDEYLSTYLKYIKDGTLKERVAVLNTLQRFYDLLYFKWKVQNYHQEKTNNYSKKFYQEAVEKLLKFFKKRFG